MSSFKFTKFKQLVGEKAKIVPGTVASDEFVELQGELALRRQGIDRLHSSLTHYSKQLSKRKLLKSSGDNLLPPLESATFTLPANGERTPHERLSILFVSHGAEFGPSSAYGQCLSLLGDGHAKIALATEAFVDRMGVGILDGLERGQKGHEEFDRLRKKLEGRRVALDAARSKLAGQKGKKGEREAEVELGQAKDKYDDTAEDLQKCAERLQDEEIQQLRDLATFLEDELEYARKCQEILEDVKAKWLDESSVTRSTPAKPVALHSFNANSDEPPSPAPRSRSNSTRRPVPTLSEPKGTDEEEPEQAKDKDKDKDKDKTVKAKKSSRSLSIFSLSTGDKEKDKDKEGKETKDGKEEVEKRSRRSSSIFSVPGFGFTKKEEEKKEKEESVKKEKEESTSFSGSGNGTNGSSSLSRSRLNSLKNILQVNTSSASSSSKDYSSIPSASLNSHIPTLPPPTSTQASLTRDTLLKTVQAQWNYVAKHPDELSINVGDKVVVEKEANAEWWIGMNTRNGERGMFPAAYCKDMSEEEEEEEAEGAGRHKRMSTEDSGWSYPFGDAEEDSETESRNILAKKKVFDSDDSSSDDEPPPPTLPKRPSASNSRPSSSSGTRSAFLSPSPKPSLHRSSSSIESGGGTKKPPPPPPPSRSRTGTVNQGYVGGSNAVQVIPPGGGILKSGKSPFED
ncbi:BAR-domain-containing protein [Atractiella rhizophila]|nr:BAR-domain-containing protein [Atractiella rhizophila]